LENNYLIKLDKSVLDVVKIIGKEADILGIRAFIVGGIVRDLLLDKKTFDLDIIVDCNVNALARKLEKRLKAKATFFKRFGTVKLKQQNGQVVDLATIRKEFYERPGALPMVSRGCLSQDLGRRDFTVNTLALAINEDCFGKISFRSYFAYEIIVYCFFYKELSIILNLKTKPLLKPHCP